MLLKKNKTKTFLMLLLPLLPTLFNAMIVEPNTERRKKLFFKKETIVIYSKDISNIKVR